MELMRATWTDSRLDDLNDRVGEIREDIRDLRSEMRETRCEIGALKRTIIQVGCGLSGTLVLGVLGLIGTQI
jgi:predicted  nucleic acid-binding Zn-ribbon protein